MCYIFTSMEQKTKKTTRWTRKLGDAVKETSKEFRDHTSIHGIKYIFADGIPFYRRIIWSSLFTIALLFCMFMINHSLKEFFTDPIMHNIDAYQKQDNAFYFPAVTVCNANLFFESRGRRFLDFMRMPTSRNITRSAVFKALPQLAGLTSPDIAAVDVNFESAIMLQEVLDYNNVSLKEAYRQVMVHRNHDFPDMWTKRVRCGMGQECLINIQSTENYIEDTVRFLGVHDRRCFFHDEMKPIHNVPYNALNCRMVCRTNKLQSSCGCSAFYMPKSIAQGNRVCNLRDLRCVSDTRVDLRKRWNCPCFQTCINVQHVPDLHFGALEPTEYNKQYGFYFGANLTDRAIVHIYYGTQLRSRIRTSLCTSVHALMASVGAYCSLFLGCSLLSGIEIVYFFTIRLLRRLQSKAAKWKPRHELVVRRAS